MHLARNFQLPPKQLHFAYCKEELIKTLSLQLTVVVCKKGYKCGHIFAKLVAKFSRKKCLLSFVNNSRRIHFELSDGRQGPTRAHSEMCMGLHGFLLKCLDFTHLNLPDNYKCDRTLKKKKKASFSLEITPFHHHCYSRTSKCVS